MPVHYVVDHELKVVFVIHRGGVGDGEALAVSEMLRLDIQISPEYRYFVDLRDARSESRSSAGLERLAEHSRQWRGGIASSPRVAVLAPQDVSFGLARMFEILSDAEENSYGVFRDLQEAASWLKIPISAIEKVRESID